MKYKKTILVAGGAGFIGSNYLNKFAPISPNCFFINVDKLTYAGNLDNLNTSSFKNYCFEKTDIANVKDLEKVFKKHQPTDVINFAAESHVDASIQNPSIFIETNVVGANNLLTLATRHKINRYLQISTDEVYGEFKNTAGKFKETDILRPGNPYSASKAAADMLALAWRKTFGLNIVIARGCNTFGPNQDKSKMIPKFIANLLDNKKIPLYGSGLNIREWIFVQDHIDAIDLIFRKGKSGEIYNIGSGCEKSNREVVRILLNNLGGSNRMVKFVKDRLGHDFRYGLNTRKIRTELGWKPKHIFETSIKETVDFYKKSRQC
jgi:dTDP-glucose 4,6-dehydratase